MKKKYSFSVDNLKFVNESTLKEEYFLNKLIPNEFYG